MRHFRHVHLRQLVIVLLGAIFLAACGQSDSTNNNKLPTLDAPGNLAAIQSRGEIVIATRNSPTSWYLDRDGRSSGPEHDLAAAFAHYLDVTPRFVNLHTVAGMLQAVAEGKVDMAAGSITRTDAREQQFTFGPDYATIRQKVVCNSDHKPRNASQLASRAGKLVVASDTSYVERLKDIAKQHPDYNLQWQTADVGTEILLHRVAEGIIGCTVADSNIVAINRRYYPSLLVMFSLTPAQHLAWPMPKGANKLSAAATKWLAQAKKSGKYAEIKNRYYGYLDQWDFVDKNTLVKRIKTVYPKYDALFTEAAKKYHFEKWLLAAQSYQESHWNPKATSPTGVRGMMMLTQNTAKSLGVTDRLDPKQSIMGGAKYLRKMENKLSEDIAPPDRYYFTLAAYNIGFYHLRDAMRLTKKLGKDPHNWADVKAVLPKLMQPKYYRNLRYGYARGEEAVRYVQNIRDYSDIIHHVMKDDVDI